MIFINLQLNMRGNNSGICLSAPQILFELSIMTHKSTKSIYANCRSIVMFKWILYRAD